MLPRAERLSRAALFQRVYAGKKSVSHPPVSLHVLERQPRSAPQLPLVGFVIGKKVHARAVKRNRAKRRVREAYRLLREKLIKSEGNAKMSLTHWYALVWQIRNEAIDAPFEEILQSVEQCLVEASKKYGRKAPKLQVDG
jgi:ribonuclease P protein component